MIIDNHTHISAPRREDLEDDVHVPCDFSRFRGHTHHELIAQMNAVGIDKAVVHPLHPALNGYVARALRDYPDRLIGCCKVDESRAAEPETLERLRRYVEEWGFRELYFDPEPGTHPHDHMDDERYRPLWNLVEALGVPISFVCYQRNFETLPQVLARLLAQRPRFRAVLVHGLYPKSLRREGGAIVIPEHGRRLVGDHDVLIDILALIYDYGPHGEMVRLLYETFGPQKLAWGTECLNVKTPTVEHYRAKLEYLERVCGIDSREDLDLILGGNVARMLGMSG